MVNNENKARRGYSSARGRPPLLSDPHGGGLKRHGVGGFRFQDLRHEYGSRLGDADVNLKPREKNQRMRVIRASG